MRYSQACFLCQDLCQDTSATVCFWCFDTQVCLNALRSPTAFDITGRTTPLRALEYPWIPSTLHWVHTFNALLWNNPAESIQTFLTPGSIIIQKIKCDRGMQISHISYTPIFSLVKEKKCDIRVNKEVKYNPNHWNSEHRIPLPRNTYVIWKIKR